MGDGQEHVATLPASFSPGGVEKSREEQLRVAGTFDSCPSLITHHSSRSAGYTIVELVTVIVILGVLGAIAGPRFFGTRVFSERGYADEVASAMRY
jgi:MSHA pilin protein MshC